METAVQFRGRQPQPARGIAVKLWAAARCEFSQRGYHGARVQGIARRAGCNVALLYRHWSSKKSLYLEVLRSVWAEKSDSIVALMERGAGAPSVVAAYLDALLADPEGAQILMREYLDGGPFLSQLVATDPTLVEPVRRAAAKLAGGNGSSIRPGLDPVLAALTIGGLSALVASAQAATAPFVEEAVTAERWRQHISDLLVHGLVRCGSVDALDAAARDA